MKPELTYIEDFISEKDEKEILKLVSRKDKNGTDRNQIIRYGSRIPYGPHTVSETIPDIFHTLNIPHPFDSVTINEYYEGQSIDYHFDSPRGGDIISVISLLGKGDLLFKNNKNHVLKYNLKPRSLSIMKDELRWEYQHSAIAHEMRYSIVFRDSKVITRFNEPILCSKCKYYHFYKCY